MRSLVRPLLAVAILFALGTSLQADETVWLASLDLSKMSSGWGEAKADIGVEGYPMSIGGREFEHGVGTHAPSVMHIDLAGGSKRFTALVGVDDEVKGHIGSVTFRIYGDGKKLFDSGVKKADEKATAVDVDLTGIKTMILAVGAAGDNISYDHGDWADAKFTVTGRKPRAIDRPIEKPFLLTPKPGPAPKINGPKVYGYRPGRPFLYRIPCTGDRPMTFAAENLPDSLQLDANTGIITGKAPSQRGEYEVTLQAKNTKGSDRRTLRIVVGDTLALTPPMGWNSWYIHYLRVTEQDMRAAADVMISSGMADFGYQYVNIDDCWMKRKGDEPYRDGNKAMLPNAKFPDIRGMVDHIHAKGLKAGLYTSPGPWTCAGYLGSHEHERIDAEKYAEWGFDFLKYDWCSYTSVATGEGQEKLTRPYKKMGDILRTLDRDIVLNLCQYGMGEVWKWGGATGGHCWRTTGDLGLQGGGALPGFYHIALSNARHDQYARPGQWNDPDYILIGWVGDARITGKGVPTTLTPNEQYCYMSMWCLMAAPLIFSGDMTKLDEFTVNVLCNAEVIEVDQDPLGRQAKILRQSDEELVLAKPMEDGSVAVGLLNLDETAREMSIDFADLKLEGKQRVRDLWRQRDIGQFEETFRAKVPRHGVVMVRLFNQP